MKAHPELLSVILFRDEASFTRDGVNNLRNVHTWSHDNPHETSVSNFQRRFSVNVWCGVLGNKLIGPFVFDNNLTRNTYEAFLRNELPGLLEEIPLTIRSQMYFQHDGAPPDRTPLDYYLWGHMKTLVYETKVDSRPALRNRIFAAADTQPSRQHCVCYSLPLQSCRKMHCSWWKTL